MKQSTSQIFNTSEKSQNNSLRSIYSLLKNNTSTSKIKNKSLTCLNFPKLYSKLKYTRNKGNNEGNSLSTETRYMSTEKKQSSNINIKKALKIYHYSFLNKKQIATNTRYILPNIETNKTNTHKIFTKLFHFNYLNSLNRSNEQYSPLFLFKRKKNDYSKFLSENYRRNNKRIINMFTARYKEKNDSILNVVQKNDGYYIKGKKFKNYFFFPHEKMNILLFHKKIMEENIQRFEKRRKIENYKKIENKNRYDKRRSISNDDIFIQRAFDKRKTRKFLTKYFYTKKNLKNKIENMVDYEFNKVMVSNKF